MGRPRTACQACAAIKSICSKEAPCARCRRLSLSCSLAEERSGCGRGSRSVPESVTYILLETQRRSSGRSSFGCLNCRHRRKKCDEQRPACGDCRRLGLRCRPRTTTTVTAATEAAATALPPLPLPPWDWATVISEERLSESAKVANLAHSSALEVLPEARASDDGPPDDMCTKHGRLPPSTALGRFAGISPEYLADWTVGERHLLNHFLQSVARALAMVRDEDNPFLRILVPMVVEDDTEDSEEEDEGEEGNSITAVQRIALVKHALAALSACHLSRVYPDFERNLLLHRHRALEGLSVDIDCGRTSIRSLTATLLLCLCEICEGSSRKWLLYLHGARALLASITSRDRFHRQRHGAVPFLIELYQYLACVASISAHYPFPPSNALLGETTAMPIAESVELPPLATPSAPSVIHPLFGLAVPIYGYLERVNQLAGRRQCLSPEFFCEARALDVALEHWGLPASDDGNTVGGQRRSVDYVEARAAALALKWAVLLRLREVSHLDNDTSSVAPTTTITAANHIISELSLIRPGSLAEVHMLFPLFMAGIASTSKASRLTVEYRLNVIKTTVGFGCIGCAQRVLNEYWRLSNLGEAIPWEDLVAKIEPGLVLF